MGACISLTAHGFELEVSPDAGGGIARLDWQDKPLLRPAMAGAMGARDPLGLSCFPMTPYVSRISNGHLVWGNVTAQIAPNMKGASHPLHGIGWRRPWDILAQSDSAVRLQLSHCGDMDWPWAFESTQDFDIYADHVRHSLSIKSKDPRAFPTSLGPHPYFIATDARIAFQADALWETSGEAMPTHLAAPPVVDALAKGCAANKIDLDHCFEGWTGSARINWAWHGVNVSAHCAVNGVPYPCTRLQLYTPKGEDFFCLEPVTARCVAFGEADPAQLGVVELTDQTLTITTSYAPFAVTA